MVPSSAAKAGVAIAGSAVAYNWIAGTVISKEKRNVKKLWEKIKKLLGIEDGPKKRKLAPIMKGATQVWYGRVNMWHRDSDLWRKEMDAMVKYGCAGYMIELAAWRSAVGQEESWWSDKWISGQLEKYRKLHKDAIDRGLWLFVSVVNDNMGSGKYGDKKTHNIGNCYAKIMKLLNGLIADGSKNVIVQPVAETQTDAGKRFEAEAKALLAKNGFYTCNNGSGGYPSGTNGMTFYAVHPSKISAANPSNSFVISDHGLIIRELNGGSLVAHGNAKKIQQFVAVNRGRGVPVVGYYAFLVEDYDEGAIKALGSAAKAAASELDDMAVDASRDEDPGAYDGI